MDINFTKEDIAFRDEVREWLANDYPKHVKEKTDNGIALTRQDMVDYHKALSVNFLFPYLLQHHRHDKLPARGESFLREELPNSIPLFASIGSKCRWCTPPGSANIDVAGDGALTKSW